MNDVLEGCSLNIYINDKIDNQSGRKKNLIAHHYNQQNKIIDT